MLSLAAFTNFNNCSLLFFLGALGTKESKAWTIDQKLHFVTLNKITYISGFEHFQTHTGKQHT